MRFRPKSLSEQTLVVTGASSGIGLATARLAASRGARVVVSARSEDALRELVREIEAAGGRAAWHAADVGDERQVRRLAEVAVARFGGFDTWVNDAGASVYAPLMETALEDARRVFDTNFWGVVHGSRVAAEHFRERGGTIVNVGSTLSDRAFPLQGIYSASKHAVAGFTDALRMELEADGAPVVVTLVKPGAIATPYADHAKNGMRDAEPTLPPPIYAPDVVARTILHCAEHPTRDVFVGAGGKGVSALGRLAPRLADKIFEWFLIPAQKSRRARRGGDGLHTPAGELRERGEYESRVRESSLYTEATLRPALTVGLLVAAGAAAALLARSGSGRASWGS